MSKPFKFKQFSVWQDQCAMKVGTDGVLLGCFANPKGRTNCLDIGTGTGLLALMMAQKDSNIAIQAIEIDEAAYEQAKANVKQSNWKSRIEVAHISLEDFAALSNDTFDCIICNPPYFEPINENKGGNLQKQTAQRKAARSTGSLDYETLVNGAVSLLSDTGILNVVLPFTELGRLEQLLVNKDLYINRLTQIRSYKDSPVVRVLTEISRAETRVTIENLTVYAAPTKHTQQYISYTKDFYLGTGKYF